MGRIGLKRKEIKNDADIIIKNFLPDEVSLRNLVGRYVSDNECKPVDEMLYNELYHHGKRIQGIAFNTINFLKKSYSSEIVGSPEKIKEEIKESSLVARLDKYGQGYLNFT